MLDPVLHHQPGNVVPRAGDVVVAAALAAVDLKGLELAVPLVVLDVEVGEAGEVQVLQHGLDLQGEGLVMLRDDDGVVANAVGGVLLQQDVAQAHQLHLAVSVGVVGQHPHIGVVPGDELLKDHVVGVASGVDLIQGGQKLLPALTDIDLGQRVDPGGPVGHAVGGLGDVGRAKGQGEVVAHGLVVNKGGGVVDAVPVAQLIELLLVDQGVQQGPVDIGGGHVVRQLVLAVGGQLHIAVPAAQQKDGLVRKLLGHRPDVAAEGVGALVVRTDPVVQNGATVTGEGGILAEGDAAHPIGLMEGPGHAVYVDVAAEEQRLEVQVRHCKTPSWLS